MQHSQITDITHTAIINKQLGATVILTDNGYA